MELRLVAVIILSLWLLIVALVKTGKLNAEIHVLILIFRTGKGRDLITRIASAKRFWKAFGTLGVAVGVLLMAVVIYAIALLLYSKYYLGVSMPGFQAVIPGVTIPFAYGVIGLITVLVVHELAHGILAVAEDVPLKSSGVVLLTSIPIGAFVEPDEDVLKSKARMAKLRVYAMGSIANIVLFLVAFALIILFQGNFFGEPRVEIVNVAEGSPAAGVLEAGMVITGINGKPIETLDDFQQATKEMKTGQNMTFTTDVGTYSLTTTPRKENPSKGYVGIYTSVGRPLKESNLKYLYFVLYWIAFLNQGIGLVNLAPIHFGIAATDGHYMLKEVISRFLSETGADRLAAFISTTTLLAIVFTVVNPLALIR